MRIYDPGKYQFHTFGRRSGKSLAQKLMQLAFLERDISREDIFKEMRKPNRIIPGMIFDELGGLPIVKPRVFIIKTIKEK